MTLRGGKEGILESGIFFGGGGLWDQGRLEMVKLHRECKGWSKSIRIHQVSAVVKIYQRWSESIRGGPGPNTQACQQWSKFIRGGQNPSEVVRIHQVWSKFISSVSGGQNPSDVVKIHQRWQKSIRGGQNPSEVVRIHQECQWWSKSIRCGQNSSVV